MTDHAWAYKWSLRTVCADLDIRQIFIKPHCPWQNGKVERLNRTLLAEWAHRQIFTTNHERTAALAPWLEQSRAGRRAVPLSACRPIGGPPSPSTAPTESAAVRKACFIVGSGRSGTSTLACTLQALGVHVPQPEVPADHTNPKGFGESQWVVDLHDRLLRRANVAVADSRPQAWLDTGKFNTNEKTRDTRARPRFAAAGAEAVSGTRSSSTPGRCIQPECDVGR